MKILLTGGTGTVGSDVLTALLAAHHDVTALVRSEASAAKAAAAGATTLQGDITDVAWLTEQFATHDGAIHAATPNDETSVAVDHAAAAAAVAAFANTDKVYIHTGGVWVWGNGANLTEAEAFHPPALTAWRGEIEDLALGGDGFRAIVIAPAVVYGHGKGLPNLITSGPRDADGRLKTIGDGTQHWATVHAADLADLYVRALESGVHGEYYVGSNGLHQTVREFTEAYARGAGLPGVTSEEVDDTRARFGDALADALLLDQQFDNAKARTLGWNPTRSSLVEELSSGSYAVTADT
ncbi:MAG: NAD-dependent epimerase/dehydratase family protein [Thermoleophilia bacterium]|nr:NAD-dependent epimerase/dehydratase family protein [Thermoleophilia bacterium]